MCPVPLHIKGTEITEQAMALPKGDVEDSLQKVV